MPGKRIELWPRKNVDLPAEGIAFDRDLVALEQAFGDKARGTDLDARLALEKPLERQEEIVERHPPVFRLGKFGRGADPLRANGEERLSSA